MHKISPTTSTIRCQKMIRILSLEVLVALVCALRQLNAAVPLTRADGLINYPQQSEFAQDSEYPGSIPANLMVSHDTPQRVTIKLTRIIQNVDDDHLREPQVSYFGALGVGTPAKMFNVVFDTGSNEIWLPYWNWFPLANNLHYSKGFDCKDSSTCVRRDREYKTDYRATRLTGGVYEDAFTFYEGLTKDEAPLLPGAQLNFGQNFLAISDASNDQFRYKPYDGVVGLAPVAQSNCGTRNLLLSIQSYMAPMFGHNMNSTYQQQMRPSGLSQPSSPYPVMRNTNSPMASNYNNDEYFYRERQQRQTGFVNPSIDLIFSFWFNPNQNAHDGGELTLGDVDLTRYIGEIISHRVNSWFDWQVRLQQVQLGSRIVSCSNGCNAILDTGANSLVGPRDDVQLIYEELQASRDPSSDLWLVDCNRINSYPMIVFNIDLYPYTIYPTHYIKMFRFKDRLICYLAIKQRDSQDWVLGTTFLGAYYTVFNFSQRIVGFATPRA